MYHSDEYYFEKKSPSFNFFSSVPFGFTADELFAWVNYGGGQELWDELSGQFNLKPLLCLNTGTQMGGWFNRELTSSEGLKGLRYRMPGLGAEVLRRMGAIVVSLPGGEIVPALKSGALDASEWVGPWLDMAMGLHKAARYYYYPGFHEPGTGSSVGINRGVWESLDASDQRVIEAVAACEYARSLAEFNANNALALRKLRDEDTVKILKFDDSLLREFLHISKDVVAEASSGDELSRKIYRSYERFRASIMDWSDVGEGAFLNSRRLA
jgi:TRAP-type mannitol/chloroaromatic compound transport system substrate-binding protein